MTDGTERPRDPEAGTGGPPPDDHGEAMRRAVDERAARRRRWEDEGERSVWRNLAMLGAFGWLIAIPPLLGVVAGRGLDARLGTGIQFTAALIVLGVALGGWLAWRRIDRE